ncbi:MAG TPA: hypothetical protein VFC85_04855, partial [Verrucomicrobiae bacterium]|nr:hypothetical protein [Verrucomicrobiae bacterium]
MTRRRKILIAIGIFLAGMSVIWLITSHVQPESEVEGYKKFLSAHGEKLDISQLLSPAIPDESNSLNAVKTAFGMFGSADTKFPDTMKMVAPGKAMVGFLQPEVRGWDDSGDFTNSWDEFGSNIAADEPAIELLHQVLERPRLDFRLDYTKGIDLLLPQLAPMKRATQKLDAAVICDLHNGDTKTATTNILTMLGLVQKNEAEGVLISHLVRIAMASIAVAPTWEFLQATNVTDAQLAALQKGWEQLDFLADAKYAFIMERAWEMGFIEKIRASHAEFEKMFGLTSFISSSSSSASGGWSWEAMTEKPRYAVGEIMWRSSWSYSDELRTLKSESTILETLRTMQTNQSQFYKKDYDAMSAHLLALGITNTGEAFFRALKIPDFSDTFGGFGLGPGVSKVIRIESARRIAIAAIALKRFQLKQGKLPKSLNELAPEFFATVPLDPYDGKPLHYKKNPDGTFLLYSVGENGVDDGGNPLLEKGVTSSNYSWQNIHALDWVWPQPATEAEIQAYYKKLS